MGESVKILAVFQPLQLTHVSSTNKLERVICMMILCSIRLPVIKRFTSPPAPTISTQTGNGILRRKTRKIPNCKCQRFTNMRHSVLKRKSNPKLMISIPHVEPSAPTQVTPSIYTAIASAADVGAPNSGDSPKCEFK